MQLDKFETYTNFYQQILSVKEKIVMAIHKEMEEGMVIGLGASTKGNMLIQTFGLTKKEIPYISERNPDKVGLRTLGTDIELISESAAREISPKMMLVLPWYFKEEINAIESYSRLRPTVGKKLRKIYKYEINNVKINWLTENRLLVRRHNKKKIIRLMNSWWKEYLKGTTRDQVSFPIVCYRNKIKPSFIKSYIRYLGCFLVKPHKASNFYWQAQYIIFFKLYELILTFLKK